MSASSMLSRLARWWKTEIVQDVPDDVALCEFDCLKGQCRHGEWANCERRLSDVAESER